MKINTKLDDLILPFFQILTSLYSLPIFLFTLFTLTGTGFGSLPSERIRLETIIFGIIGLFYLLFPLYLFILKRHNKIKRWMEYLVVFMGLSPIILYIFTGL